MASKKPGETARNRPRRIFIVDDHPIVRQGLSQLIDQEADLVVCGEAESARQALESIPSSKPNIVLADISLAGVSGIELIKEIRLRFPKLLVLVISMHDGPFYVERSFRAGARGYIVKDEASENMIAAIRRVLGGEIYISDKLASRIFLRAVEQGSSICRSPLEQLSDRELEVFQLIAKGRSTRTIAEELHLSVKTIETHREHIKEKLKLKNATELLQYAVQWQQSLKAK